MGNQKLWQKLSNFTNRILDTKPPKPISMELLEKDWRQELPYLDWRDDGNLAIRLNSRGQRCLPIRKGAVLPKDVAAMVEPSGVFSPDPQEPELILPPDAPFLADYNRVKQYRLQLKYSTFAKIVDDTFSRIADPDNPEPLPRKVLRERPELAAWLNGELPDYSPAIAEYQVLWPAFIERRRRIKERGLAKTADASDRENELTRPMTKQEAANIRAKSRVANATDYFKKRIASGQVTAPIGSGQEWRFYKRDFPQDAETQEKIS